VDLARERLVLAGEPVKRLLRGHVAGGEREEPHLPVLELALEGLVVRDDEPLRRVAVLEVVVHAFALHPPGDEGEVALLVLAHVLVRGVVLGELEDDVVAREAAFLEDGSKDLGRALVREDAAMEGPRELPEARHHGGAEERLLVDLVEQLEGREHAVEREGRPAVVARDIERDAGPDYVTEIDPAPLRAGEQVEGDLVQARDALGHLEAADPNGLGKRARAHGEVVFHSARSFAPAPPSTGGNPTHTGW
jgi:hypothetical protein